MAETKPRRRRPHRVVAVLVDGMSQMETAVATEFFGYPPQRGMPWYSLPDLFRRRARAPPPGHARHDRRRGRGHPPGRHGDHPGVARGRHAGQPRARRRAAAGPSPRRPHGVLLHRRVPPGAGRPARRARGDDALEPRRHVPGPVPAGSAEPVRALRRLRTGADRGGLRVRHRPRAAHHPPRPRRGRRESDGAGDGGAAASPGRPGPVHRRADAPDTATATPSPSPRRSTGPSSTSTSRSRSRCWLRTRR